MKPLNLNGREREKKAYRCFEGACWQRWTVVDAILWSMLLRGSDTGGVRRPVEGRREARITASRWGLGASMAVGRGLAGVQIASSGGEGIGERRGMAKAVGA